MRWTIGKKLFIGFFSITLLTLVVAGAAFVNFSKIDEASGLVKVADEIMNHVLELRIYEKNYLLWYEQKYVESLKETISHLGEHCAAERQELHDKADISCFDKMTSATKTYEGMFNKMIKNNETDAQLIAK